MAIGMSDVMGRPGSHVVAQWPMADMVHALLVCEAAEGSKRYEARRSIAMGGA